MAQRVPIQLYHFSFAYAVSFSPILCFILGSTYIEVLLCIIFVHHLGPIESIECDMAVGHLAFALAPTMLYRTPSDGLLCYGNGELFATGNEEISFIVFGGHRKCHRIVFARSHSVSLEENV